MTFLDDLTCKRGSVGQSEGLLIPRSSVRFRLKPENSTSHGLELHRPSIKGTKLFLKVIKAIIIIKRYFALVEGATFKSVIRDERYARVGGEESQMLQDPYHRAQAHRPSK